MPLTVRPDDHAHTLKSHLVQRMQSQHSSSPIADPFRPHCTLLPPRKSPPVHLGARNKLGEACEAPGRSVAAVYDPPLRATPKLLVSSVT